MKGIATGITSIVLLQALAVTALASDVYVRRDSVVPVSFNEDLNIRYLHQGDPFSVTVSDNRDLPRGTRLNGHIVDIRRREGRTPAYADLQFDEMVLPDGTRSNIYAVPVSLRSRGVYRDRDGRLHADPSKVRSENYVIGGLLGGLLVGSIIHKPFEGTFVGALAGVLLGEAAKNDPQNTDMLAIRGAKAGALFQEDVQISASDYNQDRVLDTSRNPGWNNSGAGDPWHSTTDNRQTDRGYGNTGYGNRDYGTRDYDEIRYDDRTLSFPANSRPFRAGSTVMVPLRSIAEQMNLNVDERNNGVVYLENDENMLRLEQGSTTYRLNGKRGNLPEAVASRDGAIYVPVEILAAISTRPVYVNGTRVERISY